MSIFLPPSFWPHDGSAEAQLAAFTAADLAEKTNSELHVVTVELCAISATTSPAHFEDVLREHRRQAEKVLEQQVKEYRGVGVRLKRHTQREEPQREIVELAEELGAGLIVMGSRGYGRLKRALLGSVTDAVVWHAHCPVTIVREED